MDCVKFDKKKSESVIVRRLTGQNGGRWGVVKWEQGKSSSKPFFLLSDNKNNGLDEIKLTYIVNNSSYWATKPTVILFLGAWVSIHG